MESMNESQETKPYWYHNTAYSIEPYFVCLDFRNLIRGTKDTLESGGTGKRVRTLVTVVMV